jgi:hypothetical protein
MAMVPQAIDEQQRQWLSTGDGMEGVQEMEEFNFNFNL